MKISKINLSVVIFTLLLVGCSDALDKFPLDAPSSATFYKNQGEIEMALTGVYNGLWWHIDGGHALTQLENTTDIGFLRDGSLLAVEEGGHSSLTGVILSIWSHLYTAIGRANNLLTNLHKAEAVPEEYLRQVEAEARFIRAYFYHHLVELYGDVPLLTETPSIDEANVARSSKADVVALIISDLEFAKNHLPETVPAADVGKVTKGAALLLLARTALYNENYPLAITASQEVMNAGRYTLYPDYKNLFDYPGIRNEEVILDVPYLTGVKAHTMPRRAGSRMAGCISAIVPTQAMVDSYLATDGLPIDESPLYDRTKPFENRDPRLAASIIYPQTVFYGYVFETHPDSTMTWAVSNGVPTRRVANQDVTNPFATFTGYLWKKYNSEDDLPDKRTASELNFILMRYAEVLLTYAEAKIELNQIDETVLTAINSVRARAYGVEVGDTDNYPAVTTTNQDELRTILRTERKVELAHEGFRLYDIRRWGTADQAQSGPLIGRPVEAYSSISKTPEIDENGDPIYDLNEPYRQVIQRTFRDANWLYPIPQSELNVNDNMTQNEGY